MTGFKSKKTAALDEDGMYLVHQTDHSDDILHMVAQPAQERNFCPRCGKRTRDLTTIHTCTPPQEKNA